LSVTVAAVFIDDDYDGGDDDGGWSLLGLSWPTKGLLYYIEVITKSSMEVITLALTLTTTLTLVDG